MLLKADILSACGILLGEDVNGKVHFRDMGTDHPIISAQDELYRKVVRSSLSLSKLKWQSLAHYCLASHCPSLI